MKFKYMSDLHFGVNRNFDLVIPPSSTDKEDVLILAGDVLDNTQFGFKQLQQYCEQFKHVILVLGNHEHYTNDITESCTEIYEEMMSREITNITIGDTLTYVDGNTVVIGATLWTDMSDVDPLQVFDIQRNMSDFRIIYKDGNRITPDLLNKIHKQHLDYIDIMYQKYHQTHNIVVVTHHAPCLQSIHPMFATSSLNPAFVNDLESFILLREDIKYWIHGHTHSALQYMIGNTQVLANPHGYVFENYNQNDELQFNINAYIEFE